MSKFLITLPGGLTIEVYANGRGKAVESAVSQHYGIKPIKVIFLKYIPGGVVYEVHRSGHPALEVVVTQ